MVLQVLNHTLKSTNTDVSVRAVVRVCVFVQEAVRLLCPLPLTHGRTDQARRGEVQDAACSESRELRHADRYVFLNVSAFFPPMDRVIPDELMNRTCQVTLSIQTMKETKKKQTHTRDQFSFAGISQKFSIVQQIKQPVVPCIHLQ